MTNDQVHVWLARLDLPGSAVAHLARTLSPDELRRAHGFFFEKHRTRFVAAHGILRALLARYINIHPRQLAFSYGRGGKPILSAPDAEHDFHFNMSHAEGLALFAVARERCVGVDLECIRDPLDLEKTARQVMCPVELTAFRTLPAEVRRAAFFSTWVIKEAVIKAAGRGLAEMDQVQVVSSVDAKRLRLKDEVERGRWIVRSFTPVQGHAAALVIERKPGETNVPAVRRFWFQTADPRRINSQ